MKPPLVSIIIPCFNAERFIGDAIRSALGQTHPNVEVIVIDDGSTDASLDIIRSFDVRWETGPNRGGCAARNRGLILAHGELIQFLDADDLLHPEKIARQVEALDPALADLVFCDGVFLQDDQIVATHAREIDGQDPVIFVLADTLPTPQPLHYRENLIAAGGFTVGLPCAQERDLHLRLACMGLRFSRVPEVLVTVRKFSHSVSSDHLRVLDQHSPIAWRAYEMLRQSGGLTDKRARAFAGLLASDARIYLRHGQTDRAEQYFAEARQMHRSGGLSEAYEKPARLLSLMIGPALTERIVGLKRKIVA